MVFLFENEKIIQTSEFKTISTLVYNNEDEDNTGGYQEVGTNYKSLVLTNYRIILLKAGGDDFPGKHNNSKTPSQAFESSCIFYGKDTFIQFLNTIAEKHKQIFAPLLQEKGAAVIGEGLKLTTKREYFPYIKVVSAVGYEIKKHRGYNLNYFNDPEESIPPLPKKNAYAIKLMDILANSIEYEIIAEKLQKKIGAWFLRRSNNMIARTERFRQNILLLKPLKNDYTFGNLFMKTLISSTPEVQSAFKSSKQCANYYRDLFKNVFYPATGN